MDDATREELFVTEFTRMAWRFNQDRRTEDFEALREMWERFTFSSALQLAGFVFSVLDQCTTTTVEKTLDEWVHLIREDAR